jgi:hypothetical protein
MKTKEPLALLEVTIIRTYILLVVNMSFYYPIKKSFSIEMIEYGDCIHLLPAQCRRHSPEDSLRINVRNGSDQHTCTATNEGETVNFKKCILAKMGDNLQWNTPQLPSVALAT